MSKALKERAEWLKTALENVRKECPPIDEQMKAFKTRKTQIDKYRENVDDDVSRSMCVFGKRWQFLIWRRESLLVETLPPNVKHLRRAMDAALESNTSSTFELEEEKQETTKKK